MAQFDPNDTKEMQRRIAQGKQALVDHAILEAFDLLFLPSCFDDHAKRLLMKLVNQYHRVRLISDEQIKRNQVESYAEQGYPMAQYVLGRYHQLVKPDKDSIEKAKKWFDAAWESGIGDAAAAKAVMMLDGYYGEVDVDRYNALIKDGLEKGCTSDYCSLSFYRLLEHIIFGEYGFDADPQRTIDTVRINCGQEESDDIDEMDPAFYKILGDAYRKLDNKEKAEYYYTKAVDMGYVECCSNCSLLYPPTNDFTHEAWELWEQTNMVGCKLRDPYSYVLASLCFETPYDELPDDKKPERTAQIKETLMKAYALGEELAAFFIGYNHYYGEDGFEQSYDEAWRWFNNAAFWEEPMSFSMAAFMIEQGQAPEQYDQACADYYRLQALRRGDNDQLNKVVEIYRDGRLAEFANEIETRFVPDYQPDEDIEDDFEEDETIKEEPESDLKLIAIIKTDRTADIIEFDVENWDELPAFVDAKRLDAIRVQPLYDISEKLGYCEHITGWVDNMGLLRGLPLNPVGCQIYPGDIVGDMILTLEDARYNPMSFTDLDDLKKVVADLGAKLVNVFLDDAPDDDGRYDAWS